jgi:hypothetical protein
LVPQPSLKLVKELYREAEEAKACRGLDWIISQEARKFREQWVLGRFAAITSDARLVYARPGEAPDFVCYDAKQQSRTNVEVTEHLKRGRRRGDEYRKRQEASSSAFWEVEPPRIEPSWIKDALEEKKTARYGCPALLIIYLNEGTFQTPEEWEEDVRRAATDCDVANVPFQEVWVLDSGGCTATRIKPVAT